MLNVMC